MQVPPDTPGKNPLLARLGQRVRELRRAEGRTARELAAASGLSPRFLSLLEGGLANVSVVNLDALARALGTTAARLLDPEPGPEAEGGAPLRLALLGLRGAGKTSIGARAAARLGLPFVELDVRIAERAGLGVGEIFDLYGAEAFRRLEREELERLLASGGSFVLATSGGLVTDFAAFERLRAGAITIWLKARPEDHWDRVVAQGDVRPMAQGTDAMKELVGLLRARRALYERAHFTVDTSALGFDRSVERVFRVGRRAARTGRAA